MASSWTNVGKQRLLGHAFVNVPVPSKYYVVLATDAETPTVASAKASDVTEVVSGHGYTPGGLAVTPGPDNFDVYTIDAVADYAYVQLKDVEWTASGGDLPAQGSARWAVLTGDGEVAGDRPVYAVWDLAHNRKVSETQKLVLKNCELRIA